MFIFWGARVMEQCGWFYGASKRLKRVEFCGLEECTMAWDRVCWTHRADNGFWWKSVQVCWQTSMFFFFLNFFFCSWEKVFLHVIWVQLMRTQGQDLEVIVFFGKSGLQAGKGTSENNFSLCFGRWYRIERQDTGKVTEALRPLPFSMSKGHILGYWLLNPNSTIFVQ